MFQLVLVLQTVTPAVLTMCVGHVQKRIILMLTEMHVEVSTRMLYSRKIYHDAFHKCSFATDNFLLTSIYLLNITSITSRTISCFLIKLFELNYLNYYKNCGSFLFLMKKKCGLYFAACGTIITDCTNCSVVDGVTTCTDCGVKDISTDGTSCVSKCIITLINVA